MASAPLAKPDTCKRLCLFDMMVHLKQMSKSAFVPIRAIVAVDRALGMPTCYVKICACVVCACVCVCVCPREKNKTCVCVCVCVLSERKKQNIQIILTTFGDLSFDDYSSQYTYSTHRDDEDSENFEPHRNSMWY